MGASRQFFDSLCDANFDNYKDGLAPIKENYRDVLAAKERIRAIENKEKRYVHVMFKAAFKKCESEFGIRLRALMQGKIDEYMTYQNEHMEDYV